jgi:hypothetical protein
MEDELTAGVQEFLDHWRALPRDGLVPHLRAYLDRVVAHLQPSVVMLDVVSAARLEVRLFGTRLADLTGEEITKRNVLDIYPPELRTDVGTACVSIVSHPCGQLSKRAIRTSGGMLVAASSIALPLLIDRPVVGCVVAYTELHEPVDTDETMAMVQRITARRWIDIGAGVPD